MVTKFHIKWEVGEKELQPKDQLKAIEMLTKRFGLDKPIEEKPSDPIEIILRRE